MLEEFSIFTFLSSEEYNGDYEDFDPNCWSIIINESAPESQKMTKIRLKTIEKSLLKFEKSIIWNGLMH